MSTALIDPCKEKHPHKFKQCVMGRGHAGAHRLGGVEQRDMTDEWVTRCDGTCEYSDHKTGIHAGFRQCWHCGWLQELTDDPVKQLAYAKERVGARISMANEIRRERDYLKGEQRKAQVNEKEFLKQIIDIDELVDAMGENLGLMKSGRFLYDRATRFIGQDIKKFEAIKAFLGSIEVQTPPKTLTREKAVEKIEELLRILNAPCNG